MFEARSAREAGPAGAAAVLARLADVVTATGALIEPARASSSWLGGDRRRALASLDRLAGVLATVRAGLLAAEERAQTSLGPGDRDFVDARARLARTGLGEARREVRQARTLGALPAVADAVAAGRVPVPHLDALARATADAGEAAERALAAPDGQARLVHLAERLSVREFAGAVARLVAEHEPDALERSVEAQRAARFLTMSTHPDGVFLRGRLDRLAGAALRLALDTTGVAPDENRDKPQADADALVALAERATSGMAGVRARRVDQHGAPLAEPAQDAADARVSGMANRPVISVLVPADTFVEALAGRRRERAAEVQAEAEGVLAGTGGTGSAGAGSGDESAGSGVAVTPALASPAVLEDGGPLAMSQLAALLCDSEIGRMVLDAESVPLDLGRTTRLFTAAQRRAVIVRDRACGWNGCDVPAAYCEVHHIRWWDRDRGPTDLANAVLLCSHHHHVVHQHDLDIARVVAPPAVRRWAPSGQRPSRDPGLAPDRHAVRWEPVRYRFSTAGGRVVSAPPPSIEPIPLGRTDLGDHPGGPERTGPERAGRPERTGLPERAGLLVRAEPTGRTGPAAPTGRPALEIAAQGAGRDRAP